MNVTVPYCVCVRYSLVHSVNSLLWLTTPKLPGSRSSAVRKNCRRLPNRERNTTENSVTCSVRGLLLIQAHLWKINGSWQPTPWGMVSFCGSCSNKNPTTRVPAYRCGTETVQAGWMVLILQWKMMRFSERFALVIVLPVVNTQQRFLLGIHREIIAVFTLMLWYIFFRDFTQSSFRHNSWFSPTWPCSLTTVVNRHCGAPRIVNRDA